jgi:hypothetical protein
MKSIAVDCRESEFAPLYHIYSHTLTLCFGCRVSVRSTKGDWEDGQAQSLCCAQRRSL